MNMKPVASSQVKAIGHDPATNTLRVEYASGGVYDYAGVDAEKHRALMAAPSIGSHLHKQIKPNHKFTKL